MEEFELGSLRECDLLHIGLIERKGLLRGRLNLGDLSPEEGVRLTVIVDEERAQIRMERLKGDCKGSVANIILRLQVCSLLEESEHTDGRAPAAGVVKNSVSPVISNVEIDLARAIAQQSGGHINRVEGLCVILI